MRLDFKQDELEAIRQNRTSQLLIHAAENCPFYSDRIPLDASSDPMEVLSATPLLSKPEIESAFPDRITDSRSARSDWRMTSTRGTTHRLTVVRDFPRRDVDRAAALRSFLMTGYYQIGMPMVEIPPEVCDTVCGDLGEKDNTPFAHFYEMLKTRSFTNSDQWRDLRGKVERHWLYNRKTYPPFGRYGSNPPDDVLDRYLERLSADRPLLVKGLSNYLYAIAKRQIQRGEPKLTIPVIKPLGSGLSPVMQSTVEEAFGGSFFDDYGSAELGCIAGACHAREGMHVFSDSYHVEVVDSEGNPVPSGVVGEIVITDLLNFTMPMIRYRIGDLGVLTHRIANVAA